MPNPSKDGVNVKYRKGRRHRFQSNGLQAMKRHMRILPGAIMGTPGVREALKIGCEHVKDEVYSRSWGSFKDDTGASRASIRVEMLKLQYPAAEIIAGVWSAFHEYGWTLRSGKKRPGIPFMQPAVEASKDRAGNLMAAHARARQNQIMRAANSATPLLAQPRVRQRR